MMASDCAWIWRKAGGARFCTDPLHRTRAASHARVQDSTERRLACDPLCCAYAVLMNGAKTDSRLQTARPGKLADATLPRDYIRE
jgi:hypothetical protein